MRWLLIFAVFSCCAGYGLWTWWMLKRRYQLTLTISQMMTDMNRSMKEYSLTLREALSHQARYGKNTVCRTLAGRLSSVWDKEGSAAIHWQQAIEEICTENQDFRLLSSEEREALKGWIHIQARDQWEGGDGMPRWQQDWMERAEKARQMYQTRGTLWAKLGILLGLALAVLML